MHPTIKVPGVSRYSSGFFACLVSNPQLRSFRAAPVPGLNFLSHFYSTTSPYSGHVTSLMAAERLQSIFLCVRSLLSTVESSKLGNCQWWCRWRWWRCQLWEIKITSAIIANSDRLLLLMLFLKNAKIHLVPPFSWLSLIVLYLILGSVNLHFLGNYSFLVYGIVCIFFLTTKPGR